MKPFLLLATRDHDQAALDEYESVRRHAGLSAEQLLHVRVETGPLPHFNLDEYSGVLLGGSPFSISDVDKTPLQLRVEADIRGLIDIIVDRDYPFLGLCYGIGTVTHHLGGLVDKTYGEGVGAVEITLTSAADDDPICAGIPAAFHAFVGHKEACNGVPDGVTLLATGQACPVQMYRVGNNVHVTQFHPELDVTDLEARMRIYSGAGYFAPDEFDRVLEMAHSSGVNGAQHLILSNFVSHHAR